MTQKTKSGIDPGSIVDQLYDIALDPQSLDTFIDAWNDAGLDAQAARKTIEDIDTFDQAYQAHLRRADTFLSRSANVDDGPDFAAILKPFDTLAAFVADRGLNAVASNDGAKKSFGIRDGAQLSTFALPQEALETLTENISKAFSVTSKPDGLFRMDTADQRGPALFQIRRLAADDTKTAEHVLVVTTQYHWQPALGDTLEEVFNLTAAEQGVVKALVEGMDAKSISATRGTSEGTVRGQIKSVLAKMNARTQSEVIRLVLSLRDLSQNAGRQVQDTAASPALTIADWLTAEVWKPLKSMTLPDGRNLEYHDMGPITGAPVLYSHMGYCLARWHKPMLKLAFQHGLRVICPIRAGYGDSDNLDPKSDILQATRDDTRHLLTHLGIQRLPYLTQGNDLIFAADFAAHYPEMVSEIIGVCARPSLPGDLHYSGMAKWHRFFLSTAKHAPHLLNFTVKAAVNLTKRIGVVEMFRRLNQRSQADIRLLDDDDVRSVLVANFGLITGKSTNASQAYAMEIQATEGQWTDLMMRCKDTKTWFVNGAEDPATDVATIAEYREHYPWIEIEVLQNAGQLLIFQHFETLIPQIAKAAKQGQNGLG